MWRIKAYDNEYYGTPWGTGGFQPGYRVGPYQQFSDMREGAHSLEPSVSKESTQFVDAWSTRKPLKEVWESENENELHEVGLLEGENEMERNPSLRKFRLSPVLVREVDSSLNVGDEIEEKGSMLTSMKGTLSALHAISHSE